MVKNQGIIAKRQGKGAQEWYKCPKIIKHKEGGSSNPGTHPKAIDVPELDLSLVFGRGLGS